MQDVAHDSIAEKLLSIAQHILAVVFGLLPIYFIPLADAPFIYTKVFIVAAAVFLALVLYSFALLRTGELRIYAPKALGILWLTFVAAVVSAIFSGDARDAFVGALFEQHTALFIGLLALTATAWMLIGTSSRVVMRMYMLLSLSALVLAAFHIARMVFGAEFLTFGGIFSGSLILSPIGSWNNLAIFFGLAIILALVAFEQLTLSRWGRIFFAVMVLASLIMLAAINFFAVWIVLGLISLIVLMYTLTKHRFVSRSAEMLSGEKAGPLASVGVSLVTFIVSVVFILGGTALGSLVSRMTDISYIEVRPSLDATIDVARSTYRDHALLGVGPNRFVDAWRQSRAQEINNTIFWSTDFQSGFGYIPTMFVTNGVIGGVLWLAFLAWFLISGVRFFARADKHDRVWYFIGISAFASGVYLWGLSLIYVSGPVLLLFAAMCTGLVYAAGNALQPERVRTFVLGSPQGSFVFVGIAIAFIVGSVGGLYFLGQHYSATYLFTRSLNMIQAGTSTIDEVEALTAQAFALSPDDEYARRIAEYERIRLSSILQTGGGTEELQAQFENTFVNALNAARTATELDGTDPNNWSTLANVYAMVVPLQIEGAYEQALAALTRARELDPQNPLRTFSLGQLEYLNNNLEQARTLTTEAVRLKPNYTEAIYFLAQLDIASGNVAGAIDAARSTTLIEPTNPVRHFQLGVLQLSDRRFDDAARSLERAVALNRDYANARYFLALTYDAQNRTEDARKELEWVLSLNPGNTDVLALIERLDNNEGIAETFLGTGSGTSTPSQTPVAENSETPSASAGGEPATAGSAPNSPLLSPVNTGTETDTESAE